MESNSYTPTITNNNKSKTVRLTLRNDISTTPALDSSIIAFSKLFRLPVVYYDADGHLINEYNTDYLICESLDSYGKYEGPKCEACFQNIKTAIATASKLGEPYFFSCIGGFLKIAQVYIRAGEVVGCFVAGPLLMERTKNRVMSKILAINMPGIENIKGSAQGENSTFLSRLFDMFESIPTYSTKDISRLSIMFKNTIIANVQSDLAYEKISSRYEAQRKISETIKEVKDKWNVGVQPKTISKELESAILAGNKKDAMKKMDEFIRNALVFESGNMEMCRMHLASLHSKLSKYIDTEDMDANLDYRVIREINRIDTIPELLSWSEREIELFFPSEKPAILYHGNSPIVRGAIELITSSADLRISLSEAADELHVNSSYLSSLFKREIGKSFSDFVTDQKIERAKKLLSESDEKIVTIAQICGFDGQSYFNRVFKQKVGMTPNWYRTSHKK